ncbi:MAG: hypothetical protein F7C35_06935 [Desulfurococcales archaeon]|nr:hypothetical protein [Desulfurococcales archaeon]
MREFAFQLWGSESYVRHISFDTYSDLIEYLSSKAPRHAYYSIALYELPEAGSMEEKNWLGSDLLFDIDLDHVEACFEDSVRMESGEILIGDGCLLEGYRLAQKLSAMIRRDLKPDKVTIYYTGHRGFHLRVICERCRSLDRGARRQIAQYFAGESVEPTLIFPPASGGRRKTAPAIPGEEEPGWRGWVAPYIKAEAPGARSLVEAYGKRWPDEIRRLISSAAVPIDTMVTQDPTRLTRLFGSLNGKGSFLVYDATETFRPGPHLSPFKGDIDALFKSDLPPLKIMGVTVQGRRGEGQSLPAHIAVHLATKGVVEPVRGEVVVRASSCGRPLQGRYRPSRRL